MPQTKNSICHYISERYNSVTIIPQVKTIMIHFGLPTTFFAKHILHSAMESCFAVALTLPQTVFEIGCGNFFSNLDYCINYAFCSSSLFSQIFTNFPQNIYQSHCLYSAYATSLCNNSRISSLPVHLRCSLGH